MDLQCKPGFVSIPVLIPIIVYRPNIQLKVSDGVATKEDLRWYRDLLENKDVDAPKSIIYAW